MTRFTELRHHDGQLYGKDEDGVVTKMQAGTLARSRRHREMTHLTDRVRCNGAPLTLLGKGLLGSAWDLSVLQDLMERGCHAEALEFVRYATERAKRVIADHGGH